VGATHGKDKKTHWGGGGGWIMNPLYQFNIQPFQGCDIQFTDDRGFSPTVIQIVPLRGT